MGALAELPDGTFDIVGDTISVLSATDLTRTRLLGLQEILQEAQAGRVEEEEAGAAIAREAPELAPLIDRLSPMMRKALVTFLLALVANLLVQPIVSYIDPSITRVGIERAVEQAIKQCEAAHDHSRAWKCLRGRLVREELGVP